MRTDREKDHEKCIYYKRFKVCVYCKRFYTNKTDLDDLYKEKESYKEIGRPDIENCKVKK